MVTRYFDLPVPVLYQEDSSWHRVVALGVRRNKDSCWVLILWPLQGARKTIWVPRAHVRPDEPGYEPA